MRQIFVVWNRGYKSQMVIAESAEEALQLSMESGHFKRPNNYRKFHNCTDMFLGREDFPQLDRALAAGRSGVAVLKDSAWFIGGQSLDD